MTLSLQRVKWRTLVILKDAVKTFIEKVDSLKIYHIYFELLIGLSGKILYCKFDDLKPFSPTGCRDSSSSLIQWEKFHQVHLKVFDTNKSINFDRNEIPYIIVSSKHCHSDVHLCICLIIAMLVVILLIPMILSVFLWQFFARLQKIVCQTQTCLWHHLAPQVE